MTISANFPNLQTSLLLDFANTKTLDPRITFSRPTTATYYDNHTTVVAEQNLVLQSQDFDNASWIKSQATATANSTTAPDGTTTADTVVSTNSSTTGLGFYQSATTAIGSTLSLYAKAGTANFIGIANTSGGNSYANFNLGTGAVASSSGCTASIVSVGSGWYRCIVANVTSAGTSSFFIAPKDADPAASPWQVGTCASGNTVFIWGAQLEQRSSVTAYTPTTTTAITNYIPTLQTAVANDARFDHNPTTRESLGLLIEEQRTNLLTYSSDFSNAAWTKTNATITNTANVSPDGTQTAQLLIPSTGSNAKFIITAAAFAANTYTQSIYAKYYGTQYLWISLDGVVTGGFFDLVNGTIASLGTGNTGTITPVGNGWYRCSVTKTVGISTNISYGVSSSTSFTTTGNGYSGIYIWGAQLEGSSSFATSYIPTVASQVTRSADSASMTGTNFSSWYRADAGTFYIATSYLRYKSPTYIVSQAGVTSTLAFSPETSFWRILNENVSANAPLTSYAPNQDSADKIALSYTLTNVTASVRGNTTVSSTRTVTPFTQINLTNATGVVTLAKLAYYPIAVTNAQLQGLTG